MFNKIIATSLAHKFAVLTVASLITVLGIWSITTMKVDILPDIHKPTVEVFAEGMGLPAEEVERQILIPIETAVAGAPGVERILGTAKFTQATINIEFAWGSDTLRNRQIVQERLAQAVLPDNVRPMLGPSTSLIDEIMWIGVTKTSPEISSMQLRTLADWTIRPALLKIPGVASVLVMGGDAREWQINLNAERMARYGVTFTDVHSSVGMAITNQGGGFLVEGGKELPIRIISAPSNVSQLGDIAVGKNQTDGRPIRLADIAVVEEAPSLVRGSAAIDGKDAVVLRIVRQPDAETLKVSALIDDALTTLRPSIPNGVSLESNLFRQENFIRAGLGNVEEALLYGILMVIVVLVIFLMNFRMTVITLTAIPLSILVTAIVFKSFGLSVNVMTLGGIAIAIGELVDDAIVDVENIFRRLRKHQQTNSDEKREHIVLAASSEVRNSIVYATMLVAVVFLPIFFVAGIEGRLLASLGAAYLVSLIASMAVSLSVTPVLATLLLTPHALAGNEKETRMVLYIKACITPWIRWCIGHVQIVMGVTTLAVLLTLGLYGFAGKEGVPEFNEGSAVVMFFLPPGTALSTTNEYVAKVEQQLMKISGVRQISNSTGRAPADAHAAGANESEMQIAFQSGTDREKKRLFHDIQGVLDSFGGSDYILGQPITHRVQMLLSGVRAPIAIKVFGSNPDDMMRVANQIVAQLKKEPGVANARVQQNVLVPEFRIYLDRNRLAESGLSSGMVANELGMGLLGDTLGQVRLGNAVVPVVARYDILSRGSQSSLRDLTLPYSGAPSLGNAGDVRIEGGLTSVDHEGGKRMLAVSANYQGSDIVGAVDHVKTILEKSKLPDGVTLSFEGTYKSEKETTRQLGLVFVLGILMILLLLYHAFKSVPIVLLIMANIPTVFIGGMIAIWISGGVINLAHLVGFISLAGIVSRNGIMLIGRSLALVSKEKRAFSPETILEATLDRVVPVLMTSLVTALALVPLLFAGDAPGKEILHPLAVVMFGGLISSTCISFFLTPALFYRFGKEAALQDKETESTGF